MDDATWAFVLLNRKSYAEATHHAAEGLALARRSTDTSLVLRLTSRSAMVAHGAWDIEQAERLYAQATAQAESLHRRIALTMLLQNWAVLRAHLGELGAQGACDAHNLPVWQAEVDVQHAAQTTDRVECWRVLAANRAPEVDGWRQSTRALLMANALRIPNLATREAYLTRIPEHRELMAAAR